MALLNRKRRVFGPDTVLVGEFDPTQDSLYRNIVVTEIEVKPNRLLYVHAKSEFPIDLVVLNQTGNPVGHIDKVNDDTLGPISTQTWNEMAIVLGVFRGDKATVELEAWTVRK
ncbi:MAG TPA: hypothetical protein VJX93_04840 [Candidatus Methanomethylophilaceae archaeon]|jgi:hypothetical protein|nr:hypothetical protein [Candidatus Methanomethylophilaceae archaeon]